MRYVMFTLADAVSVREGLMNVLSAGVTILKRGPFPDGMNVFLAAALELDAEDLAENSLVGFEVSLIRSESGEVVHQLTSGPTSTETFKTVDNLPLLINLPIDLRQVPLPGIGMYELQLKFTGMASTSLRFKVI